MERPIGTCQHGRASEGDADYPSRRQSQDGDKGNPARGETHAKGPSEEAKGGETHGPLLPEAGGGGEGDGFSEESGVFAVDEVDETLVEGNAFFAGDGVEAELGFGKVAGGEGVVAGGEATWEGGGEGLETGVGVDAVEGMGACLGGLDIVDPAFGGAGEGIAAGLGADIVAEADLAVGELGEGGGAENEDEEADDADDKLDHRLSAASATRCAHGGWETWSFGGLVADCLRLDCQDGKAPISRIGAD